MEHQTAVVHTPGQVLGLQLVAVRRLHRRRGSVTGGSLRESARIPNRQPKIQSRGLQNPDRWQAPASRGSGEQPPATRREELGRWSELRSG